MLFCNSPEHPLHARAHSRPCRFCSREKSRGNPSKPNNKAEAHQRHGHYSRAKLGRSLRQHPGVTPLEPERHRVDILAHELWAKEAGRVAIPREHEVLAAIILGYRDGCHRHHRNHEDNEQDTHQHHAGLALPGAPVQVFGHDAQPGQVRDGCEPGEVAYHLPVGPLEDWEGYETGDQDT